MHGLTSAQGADARAIGFKEFVTLVAALMAMTAISIDSMLPALPAIGRSLGVANANDRQWVISAFMLGFGMTQILYGSLADRFGRRPVLIVGLCLTLAFNLIATLSTTFPLLLVARFASGTAVASCRVLAVSIVRDRFVGDEMARVMSLVSIVFMIVPIVAPNIGQGILLIASWRWIFAVLATAALLLLLWVALRLPETLHPEDTLPLSLARVAVGFRFVVTDRLALGYTTASMLMQGVMFGFILSIQQIFEVVFHAPRLMAPVFSAMAATMAAAAFLNSRIVIRYGARPVSHRALVGLIAFAMLHLAVTSAGLETIAGFAVLQALMMSCFGLAGSNFSSLAMRNMGHLAGTASSVQGFVQTVGGVLVGVAIGQAFNGTTIPVYFGFTMCGLLALLVISITERGRLFQRGQPPASV